MAAWLVRREERTFGVETERGSSGWEAVVFEEREETLVEVWGLGLRRQTKKGGGGGESDASVGEVHGANEKTSSDGISEKKSESLTMMVGTKEVTPVSTSLDATYSSRRTYSVF